LPTWLKLPTQFSGKLRFDNNIQIVGIAVRITMLDIRFLQQSV